MKDLKQTIISKLKDNAKLTLKDDGVDMKRVFETDADSMVEICNTHADEKIVEVLKWLTSEDAKFSIMYGSQDERFADEEKEYTPEELLTIYKQTL